MLNKRKQPAIKSLIAHGCRIDGNFGFADGFRLDGELIVNFEGQADKPSILDISESAQITDEVQADHVIIKRRVDGPVYARVMLEQQPKARVMTYKLLEMHQGALVAGRLCPMVDEVADEKPTLKLAANNQ